jgi:hypothetical protein
MNEKRHFGLALVVTAAILAFGATRSQGAKIIPEVSVDTQPLAEEARTKLQGLDSALVQYLRRQRWVDERDYEDVEIPVQVSIYFTSYSPGPPEDHYEAKLIVTNKQDARVEDVHWEFGLRPPPYEFRPQVFDPFKSVVEFFTWYVIGIEYDKLEYLGGQRYYDKAQELQLQSTGSIYIHGWDQRIQKLRDQTSERNKPVREFNFYYSGAVFADEQQDPVEAARFLYWAVVTLGRTDADFQLNFFDTNRRQLLEVLRRATIPSRDPAGEKAKLVEALSRLDPQHRQDYESVKSPSGGQ